MTTLKKVIELLEGCGIAMETGTLSFKSADGQYGTIIIRKVEAGEQITEVINGDQTLVCGTFQDLRNNWTCDM